MNVRSAILILATLCSTASADELTLRNGSTFSGATREQVDRVTVETEYGTMTFKKIDVRSIVKSRNVVDEYDERLARASSTQDLLDLAAWATEKGMKARADDLHRRVIARDPDQADARRALGYERVDGVWLRDDDLYAARGFVKVDGRWLSKDVAASVLQQREQARAEAERVELEAKAAARQQEVDAARLALERERLELERQALAQDRRRIDEECRRNPGRRYDDAPCPELV